MNENSEICVKVATQTLGTFNFTLPNTTTGLGVKYALAKELTNGTNTQFRLLYRGRHIEDETALRQVESNRGVLEIFAVEEKIENSAAFTRVNNVRLLKRNVDECVSCAKNGDDPRQRSRFNDPTNPTPPQPNSAYLAAVLLDMSDTFKQMSDNMSSMSAMLKSDISMKDDDELYERNRRIVQNNMDCVRYANPMLLNLTKLRIPINRPDALVQLTENRISPVRS